MINSHSTIHIQLTYDYDKRLDLSLYFIFHKKIGLRCAKYFVCIDNSFSRFFQNFMQLLAMILSLCDVRLVVVMS